MTARAWNRLRYDRSGIIGLSIVLAFLIVSAGVWAGWLGQSWSTADGGRWEMVSSKHWFGTNIIGQDIYQRSIYSVRIAFEIGLLVALASTILGAVAGAVAGWYKGSFLDEIIIFIMGVLDSIPFYLLVAAVAFAMQGNSWAMHIAMVATFWTGTSRLVRAEVMRIKSLDYIQASRAIGLPTYLILARHVIPNTFHLLLVQASIIFVAAIKAEVILSFLGLGVQDGVSWGLMLAESTQDVLAGHFNNFLAASIMLFTLLMGFNLLADALQDAFDPTREPV